MKVFRLLNRLVFGGLSVLVALLVLSIAVPVVGTVWSLWHGRTNPCLSLSCLPHSSIVIPANGAWNFIVPDHYIGDLAIAFHCPGGHPLVLRHGVITTRLSATGPVCVSDVTDPDAPQMHATWANGTPLPTYNIGGPIVAGQTVFTFEGGMGYGDPSQPNWFFTVYYVGPSDCARHSFSLSVHDHLPARCHYVDLFTFTKNY